MSPLRGDAWESWGFFCYSNWTGFYIQKLWGLIFLALEPWGGWSDTVLGYLVPKIFLPGYIYHMWVWDWPFPPLPIFAPPTHLNECDFFNSLFVELPYSLIFWLFRFSDWVIVVCSLVVIFAVVVWGGKACLSMLPSWLAVFLCILNTNLLIYRVRQK